MSDYLPVCKINRDSNSVFDLLQAVSMELRSDSEYEQADKMEREVIDSAETYEKAIEIVKKYVQIRYLNLRKVKKK